MADISIYLQRIMEAVYGEQVRGSIHDAIKIMNDVTEANISAGTAVDSPSSSSEGFFAGSTFYINTDEWELWHCIGVDTWESLGHFIGNGIANITKTSESGLVDTYTIEYTNSKPTTYDVTNGADGNKWYHGTTISGGAVLPTVYPSSGIAKANAGDSYLNSSEGYVYVCITGGDANTATWSYSLALSGGGGAAALNDLNDVNINPTTLANKDILEYDASAGEFVNVSDRSFVRYAGSITFSALMSGALSTYLTAAYEDMFFLVTDGGTLDSTTAAYWTGTYSAGDVIPPDSHIAVINIAPAGSTPSYRFDDFGGYVDISGKADKSQLPYETAPQTISSQNYVQFSGIKVKSTSIIRPYMDVDDDPSDPPEVAPIGYKSFKIKTSSVVDGELQADGVVIMYFNGNVSGTFSLEIKL